MTNPKITRKEAESALERGINSLLSQADECPNAYEEERINSAAAILRQCRIIEPGGLDAETRVKTLRSAADDADKYYDGTITSGALRDYATQIEKGE